VRDLGATTMAVEFRVLGTMKVLVDGRPVELGHRRQRCVLAVDLNQSRRLASRAWTANRDEDALALFHRALDLWRGAAERPQRLLDEHPQHRAVRGHHRTHDLLRAYAGEQVRADVLVARRAARSGSAPPAPGRRPRGRRRSSACCSAMSRCERPGDWAVRCAERASTRSSQPLSRTSPTDPLFGIWIAVSVSGPIQLSTPTPRRARVRHDDDIRPVREHRRR
jgi:hypothetical protein